MKLSLVFELLLIFVLLAFAASKNVRHRNNLKKDVQISSEAQIEDNSINKYCKCVEAYCNCCRDFSLPVVNLNGPGCAALTYLQGDKMAVSLSFGKKVITNRTLSSRKPSPVCMPLPGGISKFCGRVYNIARAGEEFRACLGLELQSKSVVEAAVRVSCFKFGPRGVTSEAADPLPLIPDEKGDDDDDDDDDEDDDYGLGADDEDEDDDDDEEESELEAVNDVDGGDYTGFSLLEEDLLGDLFGSSGNKIKKPNKNKNKKKQAPAPSTTTRRPRPSRRPARRPTTTTTQRPTRTTTVRIRPVQNRRPTRRPSRRPTNGERPTRRPGSTTSTEQNEIVSTSILTSSPTPTTLAFVPVTAKIHTSQENEDQTSDTFEPIIATRPPLPSSTVKPVTNFDEPSLVMSVAHITDQLASMPVISMNNNEPKDTGMASKPEEQTTYEKVETISPKTSTTTTETPIEEVNDDMIQIVQNLDSAEEVTSENENLKPEESRAHFSNQPIPGYVLSGAFKLPKKKQRQSFGLEDLDVLDLTEIGETIGDELGIFGGKKRQIRDDNNGVKDGNDYYDDMMGSMTDTLLMMRNGDQKKKKRGRQNKMMRGDWSLV